jgi:hypothetical protein
VPAWGQRLTFVNRQLWNGGGIGIPALEVAIEDQ